MGRQGEKGKAKGSAGWDRLANLPLCSEGTGRER